MAKKYIPILIIMLGVATWYSCKRSSTSGKVTYTKDIKPIWDSHCISCHKGGSAYYPTLNSYSLIKDDIDKIITRIQLPQTDGHFMPQGASPLSQTEINTFKQWKTDGLLEN